MNKREIAQFAETLFAHTDAYNFPALFANRDASRQFILRHIQLGDPQPIVVSDILGTGKTFLVNMVLNELGLGDQKPLICGRFKPQQISDAKLTIIDEWDIKANPKRFQQSLDIIANAQNRGPLILLGDLTMKSAGFMHALGSDVAYVPMEPLNPKFFRLAMQQRAERVVQMGIAPDFAIIDPKLEAALVPDWPSTSANFRDVLKALMQMAGHLPPVNEEGMIGAAEAQAWLAQHAPQPGMSALQKRFYEEFTVYLRGIVHTQGWDAIRPFEERTLRSDLGFEDLSDEAFRIEVVEPLARTPGLVSAMGQPQVSTDGSYYDRFPGPYLPGTYTRLRTAFGA